MMKLHKFFSEKERIKAKTFRKSHYVELLGGMIMAKVALLFSEYQLLIN